MDRFVGRIEVLADPPALARRAAEWMTATASGAKGPFRVALSGGSTPKALYGLLSSDEFRDRFPWRQVSWFWGDERFVPYDHPESNYRMAREAMLAKVPVPPENIFPIPTDGEPEDAARRYVRSLRGLWRTDPRSFEAALRYRAAGDGSRWSHGVAAPRGQAVGRAQALGGRRRTRPPGGPYHADLPGHREQPAHRLSGGRHRQGGDAESDPRGRQPAPSRARTPPGRTDLVRRPRGCCRGWTMSATVPTTSERR